MLTAIGNVCTMKYLLDKLLSDIQFKTRCCPMPQTRIAVHLIKIHVPPVTLFFRVWNSVRISWILDPIQCIIVSEGWTRFHFKVVPCLKFEQSFRISILHFKNKFLLV